MNKIAVPIWNGCVSNVFDFADTVQLISLQDERIVTRRDMDLTGVSELERMNRVIDSGSEVLLCGAISRRAADRISCSGIEVVSLVCGPVDKVVGAYLSDDLTRPEFVLPGCREGSGRCSCRRRGRCGRHS